MEQKSKNLHNALVHSKSCENMNSQVACCTKHDHAPIAPAAACGATCIAQYMY